MYGERPREQKKTNTPLRDECGKVFAWLAVPSRPRGGPTLPPTLGHVDVFARADGGSDERHAGVAGLGHAAGGKEVQHDDAIEVGGMVEYDNLWMVGCR